VGKEIKRLAKPDLFSVEEQALATYENWMREREELATASSCNYQSDLRQFIAWCEQETTEQGESHHALFSLHIITVPMLTQYRSFLQQCGQKSALINRFFWR